MKPVAVTVGDVSGIGPEIVVRTLADAKTMQELPAFVIGPANALVRAAIAWAPTARVRRITGVADHHPAPGVLDVLDVGVVGDDFAHGQVSAATGRAAFEAISKAIDLAKSGQIDAICTAPIHKEALAAAGVPYPGHTEMLAELSSSVDTAMMLVNPQLRTMLVTVHGSLLQAVAQLSVARELRIIRLAHRTLLDMGIARPRIAIAGLNPHAGEGGLFGREDIDLIAPAVTAARAEGIDATGPLPGDTVFMQARRGRYDLVVAQYHDQGLIPIKLLGVEDGVNVTAGLPFVRTSPDHGTAFDIAGRGVADISSLRVVYERVRGSAVRYVGFKDVGLPWIELDSLARRIKADGRQLMLEVVSTTADSELASVEAAARLEVDFVLGGRQAEQASRILANRKLRYFPFAGHTVGHPTRLTGSADEIVDDAKRLAALPGVQGLDLLAYRFAGNVPALTRRVVEAVELPVIAAGSIDRASRIAAMRKAGVWAFTVGSALFDGACPVDPLRSQMDSILTLEGVQA